MTNSTNSDKDDSKPKDRRITKPIIERRRRERINGSLKDLKAILEATFVNQIPRDSKMEKADILELTVTHLRNTQRRQLFAASAVDPSVMERYRSGFSECAREVGRFLTAVDGVNDDLRNRVFGHLTNHVNAMRPRYTASQQWQVPMQFGLHNLQNDLDPYSYQNMTVNSSFTAPQMQNDNFNRIQSVNIVQTSNSSSRKLLNEMTSPNVNTRRHSYSPDSSMNSGKYYLSSSPDVNSPSKSSDSSYIQSPNNDSRKEISTGRGAFKPIVKSEKTVDAGLRLETVADNSNNDNSDINGNNDNNDDNQGQVAHDEDANMWRPW